MSCKFFGIVNIERIYIYTKLCSFYFSSLSEEYVQQLQELYEGGVNNLATMENKKAVENLAARTGTNPEKLKVGYEGF